MPSTTFGILRYPGSKGKAARDLASLAPLSYSEYREPFSGSACMLAHVPQDIPRWINDADPKVVKFLTRLRDDDDFVDEIIDLKHRLTDATEIDHLFHDAKFAFVQGSDLAYLLLARYAYGQIVGKHRPNIASFAFAHLRNGFGAVTRERIIQDRETLQGVQITLGDYSQVLDAPGDDPWCMIDPPYDFQGRTTGLYEYELTTLQQRQLKARLARCQHRFLLTHGITPLTEELYLTGEFNVTFRQYQYCCMMRLQYEDTPYPAADGEKTYSPPKRLEMIVRNYSAV